MITLHRLLYCKYLAGHNYERVLNMPEKIYGRWYRCERCKKIRVEAVCVDTEEQTK